MTTFEEMYLHIQTKMKREPRFEEFIQGLAQEVGMPVDHVAVGLAMEVTTVRSISNLEAIQR